MKLGTMLDSYSDCDFRYGVAWNVMTVTPYRSCQDVLECIETSSLSYCIY
jgi:hypothetical protein